MAINLLKLYVAVDTKRVVQGLTNGGDFAIPALVQNDLQPMEIVLMRANPTGGITSPFTQIEDALSLRCGVVTPGATVSVTHALATLSFDGVTKSYKGSLDLNTANIQTLLGTNTTAAATFEIEVTGSNEVVTIQKPVTVYADGLKSGTPNPIPGQTFYTAQETGTLFLGKNRPDSVLAPTLWSVLSGGSLAVTSVHASGTTRFAFDQDPFYGIVRRGDVVVKAGGTYSGSLFLAGDPIEAMGAANKRYVDVKASSPGTLSGPLYLSQDPVANNEAATKAFVISNSGTATLGPGLRRVAGVQQVDFQHEWQAPNGGLVASGTHTHNSDTLVEGATNLFFSGTRVRATTMGGSLDTVTEASVTPFDTVLTAIGKLQATKITKSSGTFTAPLVLPPGAAATPSVTTTADTDTGIFWPAAANSLGFTSAAAEVMRVSEGGLSIGTTSHLGRLSVAGGANEVQLVVRGHSTQTTDVFRTEDSGGNIKFRVNQHHGLQVTTDGLSASDTKGVRVTASSASGAASYEMVNNLGGTPSALKLTGTSQSPSNTVLLVNEAAGDVALMTDGIVRLTVKESGVVQVTNLRHMSSGGINEEGGMWQDASQKAVKMYIDSLEQAVPGVLFIATADTSVTNTASETTIIPAGDGTLNLPGNFWVIGKTLRVSLIGTVRTKVSSVGTFEVKIKYGSTVLATTGGFNIPAALSDVITRLDLLITCRSTGVSGVVFVDGSLEYLDPSDMSMDIRNMTLPSSGVVDTTVGGTFGLTATWQTADTANTWTTRVLSIEVLN